MTPRPTEQEAPVSDEEIIYEKKVIGDKNKVESKSKSDSKPKASPQTGQSINYATHPPVIPSKGPEGLDLTSASRSTGAPLTEEWTVNESFDSLYSAVPSTDSPMSEPSIWTPNETPPSTPNNTPSLTSESVTSTVSKESFPKIKLETYFAVASGENVTASDTKVNPRLHAKTSAESSCLSKGSGESVPIESDKTNSSESCKTPVAPLNEVIITMEDDEKVKLVLVPSIECSSKEILMTGKRSKSKETVITDGKVSSKNEKVSASSLDSEDRYLLGSGQESSSGELIYSSEVPIMPDHAEVTSCKPPLPPPPMTPLAASSELRRGLYASKIYIKFSICPGIPSLAARPKSFVTHAFPVCMSKPKACLRLRPGLVQGLNLYEPQ